MEAKAARFGAGLVVFVCFLVAAIEGYDIQAFGVAAPKLGPQMQLGPSQIGWVGSIAMIGLVIGAFCGGWLADRVGRKPVLLVSVAAFGVFSIATASAGSYDILLATRFATGLGFGGALPILIAMATEIARPKMAAATTTAMFCGMPVGGAAVSLAARLAGDGLDWRSLFVAGGIAPLVLLPLMLVVLPETRDPTPAGTDRAVLRGLLGEGRWAATVCLWVTFFLNLVVLYLALNWLPTLVVAKGLAPSDGFTASLAFNVAGALGALALGVMSDRFGWRRPLLVAFGLLAVAMAGLAVARTPLALDVLSAISGACVVGALFVLYSVAPALYPAALRGAGAGAAVAVGRIGSIVGPLVAGELRAAGATPGEVFLSMAPVAVVAAASLLLLGRLAKDA